MTPLQWIAQWQGRYQNRDGLTTCECVDLAQGYNLDVVHGRRFTGNAVHLRNTYDHSRWTWIGNTPTNFPALGDVVVWGGPDPSVGTSVDGHVALAVAADPNALLSFDQNWPPGSPCHLQLHNYVAVLGWLHPR